MKWRFNLIMLVILPTVIYSQEIIWEDQSLTDEQALRDSMVFTDPGGLVEVRFCWDTIVDRSQSIFRHEPLYGDGFISFEEGMQGNESGYLTMGFDNSFRDTGDWVVVEFTFDQPVINLTFSLLDVDQGLDDSGDGPNWDDAVEVFYNEDIPVLDTTFYTTGSCVSRSGEPGILGFDGDSLCTGVHEFDSTANIYFHFKDTLITRIKIKYGLTGQSQPDPSSQQIGIGDLFFQPSSQALPIELVYFEAHSQPLKQTVNLKWETALEINSEYFEVEHALEDLIFRSIGTRTSRGNSNSLTQYSFLHQGASAGDNYYRLKSVDRDGSFQYSDVEHVFFYNQGLQAFPNPVTDYFRLKGNVPVGILVLYDMSGKAVFQSQAQEREFNISHLLPGVYLMDISSWSENFQQRIIKQ